MLGNGKWLVVGVNFFKGVSSCSSMFHYCGFKKIKNLKWQVFYSVWLKTHVTALLLQLSDYKQLYADRQLLLLKLLISYPT